MLAASGPGPAPILQLRSNPRGRMVALRLHGLPRPPRGVRRWAGWLRARIRSSELWLVLIAAVVGAAAGFLALTQGAIAHAMQVMLFGIEPEVRLSAAPPLTPVRLIALPVGAIHLLTTPRQQPVA